jgi:acyl transferase domain-containing protein
MGVDLMAREPVFRAAIERCAEVLRPHLDLSIVDELRAHDGASRLRDIEIMQPANFAVSVALAELWRSWGIVPDAVIDRSKGSFPVPAIRQLEGPYLQRVRDALHAPEARERGLFDPATVERMLQDPNSTRTAIGANALWQLGLIEMWLQQQGVR